MKKLLLIPLLAAWIAVPLTTAAQSGGSTLVLWHADGTTTDVALFTRPQVLFSGDKLLVTSPVATMEYAATDIVRFTYRDVPPTGISLPQADADCTVQGGSLLFRGLKPADRPVVFTAGGVRVPVQFTPLQGGLSLPLSALPAGVYILSVNGRTSKFTKK